MGTKIFLLLCSGVLLIPVGSRAQTLKPGYWDAVFDWPGKPRYFWISMLVTTNQQIIPASHAPLGWLTYPGINPSGRWTACEVKRQRRIVRMRFSDARVSLPDPESHLEKPVAKTGRFVGRIARDGSAIRGTFWLTQLDEYERPYVIVTRRATMSFFGIPNGW
jgi:hypothetical protein